MELADFEAEVIDDADGLDEEKENTEDQQILDGSEQGTSLNFCRKFHNQSREISDALNDSSDDGCKLNTRDLQPEMYWDGDCEHVQFDNFEGEEKAAEKFKKSLCSFEQDSGDSFYNAILYSLVYKLSNKKLN